MPPRFFHADNDSYLCYRKSAPGDDLLIAVNLDPTSVQETNVEVPIGDLGLRPDQSYQVEDLLSGTVYTWYGARNYVRLDPAERVGHVLRLIRT